MGGGDLPDDFIAYLEVLIGGEKDLLMCQMNNYNFGPYFKQSMAKAGLSSNDIYKIKIWESDYPKEFPVSNNSFTSTYNVHFKYRFVDIGQLKVKDMLLKMIAQMINSLEAHHVTCKALEACL